MLAEAFHYTSSSCRTSQYRRQGSRQLCRRKIGCLVANPLQPQEPFAGIRNNIPQNSIQLGAISSSELNGGVFSTQDIIVGLILGVLLALMTSFLQGRRSQNDFVLWDKETSDEDTKVTSTLPPPVPSTDEMELDFASNTTTLSESSISSDQSVPSEEGGQSRSTVVFDGDDWKEMSRPENYVFYKRNLNKKKEESPKTDEQKWVIVALLALFVPIFSVEFFFALSRQVLCGGGDNGLLSSLEAAQYLCSPVR